jgi:hypothetical protein
MEIKFDIPYQRDAWAESCPMFNFAHFPEWAGEDQNFQPFENWAKYQYGLFWYILPL